MPEVGTRYVNHVRRSVRRLLSNAHPYRHSIPLIDGSTNAPKADIYPVAGLFAGSVFGGRRPFEKEGEGQRRR